MRGQDFLHPSSELFELSILGQNFFILCMVTALVGPEIFLHFHSV